MVKIGKLTCPLWPAPTTAIVIGPTRPLLEPSLLRSDRAIGDIVDAIDSLRRDFEEDTMETKELKRLYLALDWSVDFEL